MRCPTCGKDSSGRHCPYCGTALAPKGQMGPQLGLSALCDLIGTARLRLERAMPDYA